MNNQNFWFLFDHHLLSSNLLGVALLLTVEFISV